MTTRTIMIGRDIDRSLDRISLEIVERNHGVADLSIVGIHTGGVFLAKRIKDSAAAIRATVAWVRSRVDPPAP